LIEEVRERGTEYVVTKRGEPVARLVPIRGGGPTLRGALEGEVEIVGDIVHNDWSDEFEVLRD
jgi:antitoxin (DNA-binding transcriptional repressor) of toxin-antitoxin stability system